MAARMVLARRDPLNNLYLNIFLEEGGEDGLFNRVNERLLNHVDVLDFRRLDSRDGTLQLTYFVNCEDARTLNALVDDLKAHLPVVEISFLQQEQMLGG
jgi:hypothetical protein